MELVKIDKVRGAGEKKKSRKRVIVCIFLQRQSKKNILKDKLKNS